MDHTYQRPLQLPACCSVLSAEEMTYTEGGALSINITPEQVMAFGINATVNLLGMMGRYAFQAAVSGMQNALNDGLGVGDAIGHYWGKLNTWSKVATIGLAGLGVFIRDQPGIAVDFRLTVGDHGFTVGRLNGLVG